jgi:hypothetical protein
VKVDKASYLDSIQHLQWLIDQKEVDWRTLDYPTVMRLKASDGDTVVAFNHAHSGVIIESMAFNPESTPRERLDATLELVNNICERARELGYREAYYISSDPRTDEGAAKHLGFEPVKCFRKRI